MAMNSKQQIILIELLDANKKSFRALQQATKISPRILKTHLNILKDKGLITEEIDNSWRKAANIDNRPRIYALTRKGIAKALGENTIACEKSVSRSLSMLESIVANLDTQKIRKAFEPKLSKTMETSPVEFKKLTIEYEKTLLVDQDPLTLKQFVEDSERFGDSCRYFDEYGEEWD
ncbi:MAG: helix-turn-helix transcriptional regulator, partial [Crenarchaeota archaeon]|nr:helix-turn-helix transcriptional regulator [Thermoproteota archaeon]